ncbi:glyoxylase-like metal-dependent hydrolase (beta-lactamase superfamily II) [Luteococcus japonicus]|uniref:Glyoxylase-like metal-dependent hydrolase (Beta-lactamase superfamily II) n=1 Tax=Luteococcus japonicus TaxID=33984 RepID=A0A3N1ZY14_9ACTN|nr:MBL fold metallo-hydrolase [Luteococcus japonicus]ROR55628.1 glyoxylase-like metal-dependent hydrolase (beta-lactamase superfamily II) [Luteococcus japonicus]
MQTTTFDDGLTLTRVVVGGMGNNAYLLDDGAGRALLVDAAAEPETLARLVDGFTVETIVTTHRHHDHVGALLATARLTGARTLAGRPDCDDIERRTGIASEPLWTGDGVQLGKHRIGVIGLVGHTAGSITLVLRPQNAPVQLFTGDSLFPGGVGKTGTPEDFSSLLDGVITQLFEVFDDDTVVWPGHGEPTTLGAERPHLDVWRQRGW